MNVNKQKSYLHICRRCGYEACTKSNLIRHLKRANICPTIKENIDIETYLNELTYKEYSY